MFFLVFVELDTQTCLQTLQIGRHRAYNCRRGGWMPEGRLDAGGEAGGPGGEAGGLGGVATKAA